MSNKREELHKGLKSLLKDIEKKSNVEKTDVIKKLSHTVAMLAIDKIELNPFQPRNHFDDSAIQELSDSIKNLGLIQPVTVRSIGGDQYQLISGERRLRASKLAGLKEVPAYIRIADDQAMIEMALVENIQRTDLNSLEIAFAYQRLIDECSLTHDKVAERVGKDRSTVTNYLRLLKLPPAIQNGLKKDSITMGHARALAGIDDLVLQLKLYNDVVSREMSVRALESAILDLNKTKNEKTTETLTPEVLAVKSKLEELFGSKIDIKRNEKGQGQFTVRFSSDENFNEILERLGLN